MRGHVLGVSLHGLLESAAVLQRPVRREPGAGTLDAVFDELADAVERAPRHGLIAELAGVG